MAECYECGKEFYGEKCWHCGWWAKYPCWCCEETIRAEHEQLCGKCGWFVCWNCEACNCQPESPGNNMGVPMNQISGEIVK